MLFIYPTLVVLFSALFVKSKILKTQVMALIATYIEVIFAFIPDVYNGVNNNLYLGSVLIFFSALTYALYLMGNGQLIKKLGTQPVTAYAIIIAFIAFFLHHIITEARSLMGVDLEDFILCMIMAVFSTVIPSFMIAEGINRIGASSVSIISTRIMR